MRIVWSARALRHLVALRSFVATENPKAASAIAARIANAVDRLRDQPGLGRPGRVPDTRELVIVGTPYIVAYTALGDATVTILAILHGKQKWPNSL